MKVLLQPTKTDLSLLLECLKYQMKCPDSQKQALLTIYSICQKSEVNVDLFLDMGGVVFVYNLSKSSIYSEIKETALFMLGALVETNVSCKKTLCQRETFSDLADCLTQEDTPLTQRRVAVYLLSVLVANNRSGQTYAQTTGCLDILLALFRTTFPFSSEATMKPANVTQVYQLWTSLSSALCGCVNNPQNEESQQICVTAFPMVKTWLQQMSLPRTALVQPICSFIAMTVSNNRSAQQVFSAVGALETLIQTLVRLASDAAHSPLSRQLSVLMTRTLSACITDNANLASGLSRHHLVPQLLSLLASPGLDVGDQLSVILTLGHCTEASEVHQEQLLECGGLSTIITLLTDSPSEELRKAATFILQTCNQATTSLQGQAPGGDEGPPGQVQALMEMEEYWNSAKDILNRIHQLEQQTLEHVKRKIFQASDTPRKPTVHSEEPDQGKPAQNSASEEARPETYTQTRLKEKSPPQRLRRVPAKERNRGCGRGNGEGGSETLVERFRSNATHPQAELRQGAGEHTHTPAVPRHVDGKHAQSSAAEALPCSMCKGKGTLATSPSPPPEGSGETLSDSQVFKCPAPVKHVLPRHKRSNDNDDAMSLCSELLEGEISNILATPVTTHTPCLCRCSGCVLRFPEVTSRTFPRLQRSCSNPCDMHMVLQEATARHQARLTQPLPGPDPLRRSPESISSHWEHSRAEVPPTPVRKGGQLHSFSPPEQHHNSSHCEFSLTPMKKGRPSGVNNDGNHGPVVFSPPTEFSLTPMKKGRPSEAHLWSLPCVQRRKRQDFSQVEVSNLLKGVKRFGPSWNSILWSYSFRPGRTNVDLAKKYQRLQKAAGLGLA
ncbi:telomere repeats-binding bouquet formation protein 1 [Aplochiton taeniatus]